MNNLNTDAFAVIEELSLPGQKVSLRAIANSAICGLVFLAHTYTTWDGPTHDDGELAPADIKRLEFFERLPHLISQKAELYTVASMRLEPLCASAYDRPMTLDDALDFAANAAASQMPADLPDELLEQLGISRAQLKLIDEAEHKRRAQQDAKLRESVRVNLKAIEHEVAHHLNRAGVDDEQDVIDALDTATHAALFAKVAQKLSKGMTDALAKRDRYDSGLADAMLISADIKAWDKAQRAFLKQIAGDPAAERASEAA